MRPGSFDMESMQEWSAWVLDHGLPELPQLVAIKESVPVAYWARPTVGAVLHLQRLAASGDDHGHGHDSIEVECFRRVDDQWIPANGSGGTAWAAAPRLDRIAVPSEHAGLSGQFTTSEDDWTCIAVDGLVGARAAWIEITDDQGTTRRPVEAPTGMFVACLTSAGTIRVLAADDSQLGKHSIWP